MSGDLIRRRAVLALFAKNNESPFSKTWQQVNELPSVKPEPCWDAISRELALEKMADYVASGYADSAEDFEEYSKIICQLPSVTQEPKIGRWIRKTDRFSYWYACSECDERPLYGAYNNEYHSDYCPHCGAKMEGRE